MRLVQQEFHTLLVGDHFAFTTGGSIYDVDEIDLIDYWGNRLVIYRAEDGLHSHLADHTLVWTLVL